MYLKLNVLGPIALIFLSLGVVLGQSAGKDEQTFKDLVKQMTDAQQAYDAATLDKLFTADYVEISPLGELDPRQKVLGFYSPEAKAAASKISTSLEITDWSARSYNNLAVVVAKLNFTITSDGKQMPPRSVRVTIVLAKEKGAWKIASAQYTGIRNPSPAQKT